MKEKFIETLLWHLDQPKEARDNQSLKTGLQILKHNWVRDKDGETLVELERLEFPEPYIVEIRGALKYLRDLISRLEEEVGGS